MRAVASGGGGDGGGGGGAGEERVARRVGRMEVEELGKEEGAVDGRRDELGARAGRAKRTPRNAFLARCDAQSSESLTDTGQSGERRRLRSTLLIDGDRL